MEKELLQQALNSILHGSTQVISKQDYNGNIVTEEIRVGDLRAQLVTKLAEKLAQTPEFRVIFERAFTAELIEKLRAKALNEFKYSDLPYDVKNKVEKQMKDAQLEVRQFKIVAETLNREE